MRKKPHKWKNPTVKSGFPADGGRIVSEMVSDGWTFHKTVHLRFDGGCGPRNPGGVPTFGWQLFAYSGDHGDIIAEECGVCLRYAKDHRTNNTAEWSGVADALSWMNENKVAAHSMLVIGDSMLVLNQLSGAWATKKVHLRLLLDESLGLMAKVCTGSFSVKWVPREQNEDCDALCQIAYEIDGRDPAIKEADHANAAD